MDPFKSIAELVRDLGSLYGDRNLRSVTIASANVAQWTGIPDIFGKFSHIVTSPPYLNAQDYFRNFKLELFVLESILPFRVRDLQNVFIGTERGLDDDLLSDRGSAARRELVPQLKELEKSKPKLARVVHRYLTDMEKVMEGIRGSLRERGRLIVVCGDNLVGGMRIRTWEILNEMIRRKGLTLFDQFGDRIACRAVPPARLGHKGLIKEEIVSAFELA